MVTVRDGPRRSQRDQEVVVDVAEGIDPADLPDDTVEAVLEALPEPLSVALERAIDETNTAVQDVVFEAEETGQTVNEVIRDQFDQFIPDEGEVPDGQAEEDDEGTSIADLVGEAEPEVFDRTFLIEKEDAPASTGDPWPIPQPWQGIPRLAFVVNLNYVYDEQAEEWVRQRPFEQRGATNAITVITKTGGDQTITAGGPDDVITFDTTETDQLGAADLANNRLVIPDDGTYFISALCNLAQYDDESDFEVRVERSTGAVIAGQKVLSAGNVASDKTVAPMQRPVELPAGESLKMKAEITNGTSAPVRGNGVDCYLSVVRLS